MVHRLPSLEGPNSAEVIGGPAAVEQGQSGRRGSPRLVQSTWEAAGAPFIRGVFVTAILSRQHTPPQSPKCASQRLFLALCVQ